MVVSGMRPRCDMPRTGRFLSRSRREGVTGHASEDALSARGSPLEALPTKCISGAARRCYRRVSSRSCNGFDDSGTLRCPALPETALS